MTGIAHRFLNDHLASFGQQQVHKQLVTAVTPPQHAAALMSRFKIPTTIFSDSATGESWVAWQESDSSAPTGSAQSLFSLERNLLNKTTLTLQAEDERLIWEQSCNKKINTLKTQGKTPVLHSMHWSQGVDVSECSLQMVQGFTATAALAKRPDSVM